jgi:hypothetical protein
MSKINFMRKCWSGSALLALLALSVLSTACGSLDAYNKPDEYEEPANTDGDGIGDDSDTITIDECATLCIEAIDAASNALGCNPTCGVNIAPDFDGVAGVDVVILGVVAAGEFDGDGACEFVQSCPEQDPCVEGYGLCLDDARDVKQIAFCTEEFRECQVSESPCDVAYLDCMDLANTTLSDCINNGDPQEYCEALWSDMTAQCNCIYADCQQGGDGSACNDSDAIQAMMIRPPV